ncbi:MAG TPA: mechanosensitive ion channel protein MscS [Myxococcales bacterium]|nr:mechanosensitive ion channel protein MscS [Deltaproteobacteria bacterium]MBU49607.1 mechanosensitive ion channel protein MscS [Deltaproteobacteria bacterium]HAA57620.1 mechanosensitive ion channel protein MscS [Myxococcales bacterium]|tara:strand:- start:2436 stop:3383 length:948 start_codon:yes stop_codon:yes gene_type:complete
MYSLLYTAAQVAEQKIVWNKVLGLYKGFLKALPQIAIAAIVIAVTWGLALSARHLARWLLSRSKMRRSLRNLIGQFVSIFIWFAGLLTAAIVVFPTLTPGKMVAALGLSSVAVGFAFKNIFENFFAGIIILWGFPFEQGDFIRCGDVFGKIDKITIRNTLIRQVDGQLVIVPNAQLFTQAVNVVTSLDVRRTSAVVGIAYNEDVTHAKELIRETMGQLSSVNTYRDVEIAVEALDSSSVNIKVLWWTRATPKEIRTSRDEVITAIKAAFDEAGIEIPFPHRTLTWSEPLPIERHTQPTNGTSQTSRRSTAEHDTI